MFPDEIEMRGNCSALGKETNLDKWITKLLDGLVCSWCMCSKGTTIGFDVILGAVRHHVGFVGNNIVIGIAKDFLDTLVK